MDAVALEQQALAMFTAHVDYTCHSGQQPDADTKVFLHWFSWHC